MLGRTEGRDLGSRLLQAWLSKAGSLDRQPTSTWPWSMSGAGSVEPSLPSAPAKPSRESLVRFRNRVGPQTASRRLGESRPRFWARPPPLRGGSISTLRPEGREHPQPRLEVVERLFHAASVPTPASQSRTNLGPILRQRRHTTGEGPLGGQSSQDDAPDTSPEGMANRTGKANSAWPSYRGSAPWPMLSSPATMPCPERAGGGDEKALKSRPQTGQSAPPKGFGAKGSRRCQSRVS